MAIMEGTRYDTNKEYKGAAGNVTEDMMLDPGGIAGPIKPVTAAKPDNSAKYFLIAVIILGAMVAVYKYRSKIKDVII